MVVLETVALTAGLGVKAFAQWGEEPPRAWKGQHPDELSPYDGTGTVYVTDPKQEATIRLAKKGALEIHSAR